MLNDWMILRDPSDHTRLRSLVNRAFTPRVAVGTLTARLPQMRLAQAEPPLRETIVLRGRRAVAVIL